MIRIHIIPLPSELSTEFECIYISNEVRLVVEEFHCDIPTVGMGKIVVDCKVSRNKGTTSFTPIPPSTTIGHLHEQPWEDMVKIAIDAYFDGREEKEHWSWDRR